MSDDLQELNIKVAVLKTRLDDNKEALSLQAKEYERRLDVLNHSHQEARDVLKTYGSTYLLIERFEHFQEEYLIWRRTVDDRLTEIRTSTIRYAAYLAMAFTVITLALQVWRGIPT